MAKEFYMTDNELDLTCEVGSIRVTAYEAGGAGIDVTGVLTHPVGDATMVYSDLNVAQVTELRDFLTQVLDAQG